LLARDACTAFVAFTGFVAAARVAGSLAALRVLAATGSSAAERLVRELLLRVILGRGRSTVDKKRKIHSEEEAHKQRIAFFADSIVL